jgi:hypothetical protein
VLIDVRMNKQNGVECGVNVTKIETAGRWGYAC